MQPPWAGRGSPGAARLRSLRRQTFWRCEGGGLNGGIGRGWRGCREVVARLAVFARCKFSILTRWVGASEDGFFRASRALAREPPLVGPKFVTFSIFSEYGRPDQAIHSVFESVITHWLVGGADSHHALIGHSLQCRRNCLFTQSHGRARTRRSLTSPTMTLYMSVLFHCPRL